MTLFEDFLIPFKSILSQSIFGLNLFDFIIIIAALVIALIIRGFFAVLVVSKVKKIIKKTSNVIDDELYDALIPPIKLLPIILVLLIITLYFDIQSTLGIYFQKTNQTLTTLFIFWLLHQFLVPLSNYLKS